MLVRVARRPAFKSARSLLRARAPSLEVAAVSQRQAASDQIAGPDISSATAEQIEWLVAEFGPTLYRVAVAIVHDRQAAEDVVQEVLVKAWTSMPSWEGDVPIRWARTVTRNTAISHLRSSHARRATPTERLDLVAPSTEGVDVVVVRGESADRMWAALAKLGEDERAMLVMHELDELSYGEIGATLGLTVSSVKSRLYRARVSLRSDVER